jgi:hypothetical protein
VQESEDTIADLKDMGEQLQGALDEEIAEINERWAGIFESAQTIQLQARKSDISVDAFGLAWVPFWHVVGQVNGATQELRLRAYDVNWQPATPKDQSRLED